MVAVLCGKCRVPLRRSATPQDVSCPSCGESDTLPNVRREVAAFKRYQAERKLERKMKTVTPARNFLKFAPREEPKRTFRFIPVINPPKITAKRKRAAKP